MHPATDTSSPPADSNVARLVAHIKALEGFELTARRTYGHMGATITDVALQARWKYRTQVYPRVKHVRQDYPEAETTSGFLKVLKREGAHTVLRTRSDKVQIAVELAGLLARRDIETEAQLRDWVVKKGSRERLLRVGGVGPKTADYLAIRAGVNEAVAVDIHVRRFLRAAGVKYRDYDEAAAIIAAAARKMNVAPTELDGAIWRYQVELDA